MQIIANMFTILGQIIDAIAGFKFNKKDKILISCMLSSSCSLAAMILLHSIAGTVSVIITLLRIIFIYIKDKKGWNANFMIFVFIGLYAMCFLDNNLLIALLMFIGNMCSFLPKWFSKDVQVLRLGGLCANALGIINNYIIGNYASIPFNTANVILIALAYIKWSKTDNKEKTNSTHTNLIPTKVQIFTLAEE